MNDFKSYAQGNGNSPKNQKPADNTASTANTAGVANTAGGASGATPSNGSVEQTVNMATMLAKAFDGKSEGQVMQTILAQAEQSKRDGTLTNADLDNFYKAVAPMLDGFKRQRLKGIIARLKSI